MNVSIGQGGSFRVAKSSLHPLYLLGSQRTSTLSRISLVFKIVSLREMFDEVSQIF